MLNIKYCFNVKYHQIQLSGLSSFSYLLKQSCIIGIMAPAMRVIYMCDGVTVIIYKGFVFPNKKSF